MHNYWFRPKKFWKCFAFYYPSSWQGWVITLTLTALFIASFLAIDARSHSVSDTLIGFAPYGVAILLIFDLLCFRKGEYPSWWKKKNKKDILSEEQ